MVNKLEDSWIILDYLWQNYLNRINMISIAEHNEIKEFLKPRVKEIYISEILDRQKQRQRKTKYNLPDANNFGWMPAINICYGIKLDKGQIMYVIPFLPFYNIMEIFLPRAMMKKPDLFGTGNAMDVVSALYYISGYDTMGSLEKYQQYLIDNAYCYFILRNKEGVLENKLFRLDLFRHILMRENSANYDFDGGLMHAYRHCSWKGKKISSGNGETSLEDLWDLPLTIGETVLNDTNIEQTHCTACMDGKHIWHIEYHIDPETKTYYLKTAFIKGV